MKILQIIQKPQRRGAEIFAFQLSQRLIKEGHQVRKVYLYPPPDSNALSLQNSDVVVGTDENHISEKFPGWNPGILKKLRVIVSEFAPDVIQVNAARTVKYGALLRWTDRNSSWILIYRNIGDPSVWRRRRLRKFLFDLFVLSRIDGIVAVSSASFDLLKSNNNIAGRIIQIPRGVDPDTFKPLRSRKDVRMELSTSDSANVLIWVGSLSPEKRLDRLLRVLQQQLTTNDNLRLWVVGEGPLRSELENYASKLGVVSAVQFLGSQEDVASLFNAADLHILTSDTEGIPGVVLEAALVGVPTIATRVGGVADCIIDRKTGILVNPENEEEIGKAVDQLFQRPDQRTAMGKNALDLIMSNFSLAGITHTYQTFYEKILSYRSAIDAKIPKHESVSGKI